MRRTITVFILVLALPVMAFATPTDFARVRCNEDGVCRSSPFIRHATATLWKSADYLNDGQRSLYIHGGGIEYRQDPGDPCVTGLWVESPRMIAKVFTCRHPIRVRMHAFYPHRVQMHVKSSGHYLP